MNSSATDSPSASRPTSAALQSNDELSPLKQSSSSPRASRKRSGSTSGGSAVRNVTVTDQTTSYHTWNADEASIAADWINSVIQPNEDPELAYLFPDKKPLPIVPGPDCDKRLFQGCRDGLILAKLVNAAVPGTIAMKYIKKSPKLEIHMAENIQQVLTGAKKIGGKLSNVGPDDIIRCTPHICLSLISQIMKIGMLNKVNLKQNPNLQQLLSDSERDQDASKFSNEQLLLKWVNFHLQASMATERLSNFSSDLCSGKIYAILLAQLAYQNLEQQDVINDLFQTIGSVTSNKERVQIVIEMAAKLGCKKMLAVDDVCNGNKDRNIMFIAHCLDKFPGLEESLSKHGAKIHARSIENLASAREDMSKQIQAVTIQLETANAELDSKVVEVQTIRNDLEVSMNETFELRTQLDQLRYVNQTTKLNLENTLQELANVQSKVSDVEAEHKKISKQVALLKEVVAASDTERQNLSKHLNYAVENVRNLEVEVQKQAVDAENQKNTFSNQLADTQKEHTARVSSLKSEIVAQESKQHDLSQQLQNANVNINRLLDEVKLTQATAETQKTRLEGNVSSLMGEIVAISSQNNDLSQELKYTQSDNARLQIESDDGKAVKLEYQKLQTMYSDAQKLISDQTAQLTTANQERKIIAKVIIAAQKSIESSLKSQSTTQQLIGDLIATRLTTGDDDEQLSAAQFQLSQYVQIIGQEFVLASKQVENEHQRQAEMNSKMGDSDKVHAMTAASLRMTQQSLNQLQMVEVPKLQNTIAELQKNLESKQTEIAALKVIEQEMRKVTGDLSKADDKLRNLEDSKIPKLESEIVDLSQHIAKKTAEITQWKTACSLLAYEGRNERSDALLASGPMASSGIHKKAENVLKMTQDMSIRFQSQTSKEQEHFKARGAKSLSESLRSSHKQTAKCLEDVAQMLTNSDQS